MFCQTFKVGPMPPPLLDLINFSREGGGCEVPWASHLLAMLSISESIPGHQRYTLARDFMLTTPL